MLPRLKNVINEQPGPALEVERERENGWERFQGDDRASKLQEGLIRQVWALFIRQNVI